jgi:hypothetical protein
MADGRSTWCACPHRRPLCGRPPGHLPTPPSRDHHLGQPGRDEMALRESLPGRSGGTHSAAPTAPAITAMATVAVDRSGSPQPSSGTAAAQPIAGPRRARGRIRWPASPGAAHRWPTRRSSAGRTGHRGGDRGHGQHRVGLRLLRTRPAIGPSRRRAAEPSRGRGRRWRVRAGRPPPAVPRRRHQQRFRAQEQRQQEGRQPVRPLRRGRRTRCRAR